MSIKLTITLGEPLIKLLMDYEFTGRFERIPLPENALTKLATFWVQSLAEVSDERVGLGKAIKAARRAFVREYGQQMLRKLFLLVFEQEEGSFTNNPDPDKMFTIVKNVNMILYQFDFQRKTLEPHGPRIVMVMECNKPLKFYPEGDELIDT